VFSFLN